MSEKAFERDAATQQILDLRAHDLAKERKDRSQEIGSSFLVFSLAYEEKYALAYQHIEKVIALPILTSVPGLSPVFLGVTYHNAQVWPVINLEQLFNLASVEEEVPEYIVLLRDGVRHYALAVRHVFGHMQLDTTTVASSLSGITGTNASYIIGVCQSDIAVIDDKAMLTFMNQVSLDTHK